jgi:hypothetical protein
MKAVIVIAAGLLLAGCVSSEQTVLPDGRQGQIISCPGLANSMADCWKEAAVACPHGYDIVNTATDSGAVFSAGPGYASGGSVMHRSMMVRCK